MTNANVNMTPESIELCLRITKGLAPYFPKTAATIGELDQCEKRAERLRDLTTRVVDPQHGTVDVPLLVAERAALARQVTAGLLTPEEAVRGMAEVAKQVAKDRATAELAAFAAARARGRLRRTFYEEVAEAWQAMVSAFERARSQFDAAIRDVPPSIDSDERARKAGAVVSRLWDAAHESAATMRQLWANAARLRERGLLPDVPEAHPSDFMWKAPQLAPSIKGTDGRALSAPLWLRRAIESGADPRLLDADAVRERIRREAAERRAARPKVTGGSTGITDPFTAVREAVAAVAAQLR